jgi:hypothetical protein
MLDWDISGEPVATPSTVATRPDAESPPADATSAPPEDAVSTPSIEEEQAPVGDPPPPLPDSGVAVCLGDPACERVVFVTNQRYEGGSVLGPAEADRKCQAAANASTHARVRGRFFKAWLSNNNISARTRLIHGTLGYIRPSGTPVATAWSDLVDGTLQNPINEDESGVTIATSLVWTGTSPDGADGRFHCGNNWHERDEVGVVGDVTKADLGWSNVARRVCTGQYRLYCFEY